MIRKKPAPAKAGVADFRIRSCAIETGPRPSSSGVDACAPPHYKPADLGGGLAAAIVYARRSASGRPRGYSLGPATKTRLRKVCHEGFTHRQYQIGQEGHPQDRATQQR